MSSAPRSKIIVRNFPPGFSDEQFRELVVPWMEVVDYLHFDQGKKPKPLSTKPIIFGRGYLNFNDSESLLDACQRLSGHHIVDPDGFEGVLDVALAPYQGVPGPSQPDHLQGTIESTPEFISFLKDLESAANPTAIPIDKQAEMMLAKERELNPWKYEKGLAKQTPLLVHLKKQANAEISLKGLSTGSGSGKGKSSTSAKSKKKKKTSDEDIYGLPVSVSAAPLAPTRTISTTKSKQSLKLQEIKPATSSHEKTLVFAPVRESQPSAPVQQAPKPKNKAKPKPKPKGAQSGVEPAPQMPTAPLKIMTRPADAKPLVQPKIVSTKPTPAAPLASVQTGPMTTYSTASKTVNQYSSKAAQSNKAKTTLRPSE